MRYDEFRNRLQEALHEARIYSPHIDRSEETIDLGSTGRHWEVSIWRSAPQRAEPFHISAKIDFQWSPFESARSYTIEEDLLTELLGRRVRPTRTEPRYVRVDLGLRARLPYGSTTPMPDPKVFGSWTTSLGESLDAFTDIRERKGRIVAVLGGHQEVEVEAGCKPDGGVFLKGVSISGFRVVRVPRVWDNPERREAEKDNGADLDRLAQKFKEAHERWTTSIVELATWIRYSPPPPDAKKIEPWFDDDDDEGKGGDGGPEITH